MEIPTDILEKLNAIQAKRARTVIQHILQHGYITTEDLKDLYGYSHPPRAARDVKEQSIPLETFNVKGKDGRTIRAYRFGDLAQIRVRLGRKTFSKAFKKTMLDQNGKQCAICVATFEERELQIDHRVPYEIAEKIEDHPADYMLLCGSCNRTKSWSCEHCENWQQIKNPEICLRCYWANPIEYDHIALRPIRRLDLTWSNAEVPLYEQLKQEARKLNISLQAYIKNILERFLEGSS